MKARFKDTLLLVGDAGSDRGNLRSIFAAKYFLLEAENAAQGVLLMQQNEAYIAAVLADIPLARGQELAGLIAAGKVSAGQEIPVLSLITPAGTGENEEYAFILGAADVVTKPYTTLSIQRRVQTLVELHAHQWDLERRVREQSQIIQRNHQVMIDTLSGIIEYRSSESGNHVLRIRRFTQVILQELRRSYAEYGLDDTTIDIITSAASLHDIGKISIPDQILNKPDKLTPEEYAIIQTHTTVGGQLAAGLQAMGDIDYLRYIYNIALYHHERWDGGGYPQGLKGDEIPICAQVVGLTDAFDALTTPRPYKNAYPYEVAVNMLINGECGVFSPKLLECLKRTKEQLIAYARKYADGFSPKSDDIRMPLPGPTPQEHALNAQEMSQVKYHSILHHLGDTVIEMDLNAKLYHVVFNPNPDFASLFQNVGFDQLSQQIIRSVHPKDVNKVTAAYSEGMLKLMRQGALTYRFQCRMFSPPHGIYQPYEVTLQRILTENPAQRMLLVIFHSLESYQQISTVRQPHTLLESPAIFDLANATLCCLNDPSLTIREGTGTLTPLTGFSLPEIWSQFGNRLVEMVLPADREAIVRTMGSQNIRSSRTELHFRLQRREGDPIWVLCRCRASVGADGAEYRYLTLTDITGLKTENLAQGSALARSQILLNQSQTIQFEWDLHTDEIICSGRWEERFGYPAPDQALSQQLYSANHFHPDDLPLLRSKVEAMFRGKEADVMDLRIANSEGLYLWSRIRGTTVFDGDGKPTHIIGMIYDIDQLKTDALSLQRQAQHDALTNLLNKASTQQAVSEYLSLGAREGLAGMLVLDLDNFKTINDTLGHFYGDAVLQQLGDILRSLFRVQDIVGRIGGDEFMVLIKDVPGEDVIRDRCRMVVESLGAQLRRLTPNLPVSVTVGAAIAPIHGDSFAELFRHADEALYAAKRKGKNQFGIYSLQDKLDAILEPGANATRIDSDFRSPITDENMLYFVFHSLYESRDPAATIQELLGFIGLHFNVSRVYIFENNEDNSACSNTFEWCNTGIRPEMDNLQDVSYETDIPGWPQLFGESGILYCTDISQLSDTARAVLEPQSIKSLLQCAILEEGVFRGFIGFDECTANHLWTQGQVALLRKLAAVFSVFVMRLRGRDRK